MPGVGGSAQERPQPRQQLLGPERLGHIVVGSGVECPYLLTLVADGGQNQNRQRAPAPDLLADVDAGTVGQHQIQHQRLGWAVGQSGQRGGLARRALHRISGIAQDDGQPAQDRLLIVDHQHAGCIERHGRPQSFLAPARLAGSCGGSGVGALGKLTANEVPMPTLL